MGITGCTGLYIQSKLQIHAREVPFEIQILDLKAVMEVRQRGIYNFFESSEAL
jgi:hypothetical protein